MTCRLDRPRPSIDSEFENIVAAIAASGQTPKWTVAAVDDEPYESKRAAAAPDGINGSADVGYVPLVMPDNWDSHFAHLYGLGPHVRRVHNALDLALRSGWTRRENCALIGPPGCAKTDICQSIERAVGADSVLEFDATATTAAGALKELNRRAELPRVLLVEEIEKTPSQEALTWLLGILDMRAAILKTTAHDRIERDVHMFAVCTVNDVERFRAINSGALASRFPNKIHFRRPPREMLGHILRREIDRIGGSDEWIEPALDYAAKIGTADPREVISIALCGGDRLLDGTYQADMDATSAAAVAEDQEANP